jgi:hypothetical protein
MNEFKVDDMALEGGPDAAERKAGAGITDMGQMSLCLTPEIVTAEISRACARTSSGKVSEEARELLTGTPEAGYQWDGVAVAKMSESELATLKDGLKAGGLDFNE